MALALMLCAASAIGLASCDTGTSPGETNVERSDVKEASEMNTGHDTDSDTSSNMEDHYDHADSAGGAVHAGDGQEGSRTREERDNNDQ